MTTESIEQDIILTVKQLSAKHPAFPEGGIRAWIFSDKNGFSECLHRVGKKVLISENAFLRWLKKQNSKSSN